MIQMAVTFTEMGNLGDRSGEAVTAFTCMARVSDVSSRSGKQADVWGFCSEEASSLAMWASVVTKRH